MARVLAYGTVNRSQASAAQATKTANPKNKTQVPPVAMSGHRDSVQDVGLRESMYRRPLSNDHGLVTAMRCLPLPHAYTGLGREPCA